MHILGQDSFDIKMKYFDEKQKVLTVMFNDLKKSQQDFELWVRETREFKELETKERKTKQEAELYKAELKAWIGITDQEQSNVLDLVKTIKKVQTIA